MLQLYYIFFKCPEGEQKKKHLDIKKQMPRLETATGALNRLDGQHCAELRPNVWLLLRDIQ